MAKLSPIPDTTIARVYALHEKNEQKERLYIGASVIGNECWRALWYTFRWAYPPQPPDGRMQRLFEDGHRMEARVIAELREARMLVLGEQCAFTTLGGHFSGHCDGIITGIPEAPKTPHILEIKTHNDKHFRSLLQSGVRAAKFQHYAQMMIYMHFLNYKRALYFAVNKNDSALYTERIEYNKKQAEALIHKATSIIRSEISPPKLHEDPTVPHAYICGWCPAKEICHDDRFARRNCRTCLHSTPETGGAGAVWRCAFWGKNLTAAEQKAGCLNHLYLPSLVPGKQIDANPTKQTVTYEMRNGQEWTDRVGADEL